MIAACPKCAARYRIDRERIGENGVRLRCSRCESVFRVRAPAPRPPAPAQEPPGPTPPGASTAPPAAPSGPEPAPTALAASGAEAAGSDVETRSGRSGPQPPASETAERATLLIAMPDAELAKRIANAAESRGVRSAVVFDGVEAMLEVQRQEPRILLLAAELPKMFGFQVCEIVKRNASLRHIHVVLAGAVYDPQRYRRAPSQLYGADSFVEVPELPEGLLPILEREGVAEPHSHEPEMAPPTREPRPTAPPSAAPPPAAPSLDPSDAFGSPQSPEPPGGPDLSEPATGARGSEPSSPGSWGSSSPSLEFDFDLEGDLGAPEPPAPGPEPSAAPPQTAGVTPAATPPPQSPEQAEQRAQAERLARIIVSDIVLYNEEKFRAALQEGNVEKAMAAELEEGRSLFEQRIDAAVRAQADFLTDELLRVARARGMT